MARARPLNDRDGCMKIDAIILREIRMPLVLPFQTSFGTTTERRIMLVEIKAEGFTGWGECVAGEHPYFSEETIDTAWLIAMQELAPALANADPEHGGKCPGIFRQVRGHRMAKAALENDAYAPATRRGAMLARLAVCVRHLPCLDRLAEARRSHTRRDRR